MFGLVNRGELNGTTESEFEHLTARLKKLWLKEHNEDGTHLFDIDDYALVEHTHVAADLPDNIAYIDVSNTFTVDQTITADLTISAGNIYMDSATAIYFGGTAAANLRYYGSTTHAIIRAGSTGVTVQNNAGNADIVTIAQATGALVLPQSGGTVTERGRSAAMGDWTSFTPNLLFGGAATGMTYGTRSGFYTQIGSTMFLEIRIALTAKGSSTGNVTITGFPTNPTNTPVGTFDGAANMTGLVGGEFTVISGSSMFIMAPTATTRTPLTDANFNNTSDIRISIFYRTA